MERARRKNDNQGQKEIVEKNREILKHKGDAEA